MHTLVKKIIREIRELVPAVIYFFVTFGFLGMMKALILQEHDMVRVVFKHAFIGAFLMAKVIFVMTLLPFREQFRKMPIYYNVLWKTLLCMIFAILIQVLEEIVPRLIHHQELNPALQSLTSPHSCLIQIWLVVLISLFWTFRDLVRAIGRPAAKEILGI